MPNWTSNIIRVAGDPADIRAFLEAVKWQDQIFDFGRIIPMPPLLEHTASGNRDFEGISHRAWFVESPGAPWNELIERPFTSEELAELAKIGHTNWYSWCIQNWGTKWDARRTEITEPFTIDEGYIEIRFDTAWSPPLPIFEKMFAAFPKLSFHCSWRNEDEPERLYSIERDTLADEEEN